MEETGLRLRHADRILSPLMGERTRAGTAETGARDLYSSEQTRGGAGKRIRSSVNSISRAAHRRRPQATPVLLQYG